MVAKLARVVALAGVRSGDRVMDVGTGTGVLIPHIAEAVGASGSILAIDISPEMLSVARGKKFPQNVEFLQADIQETGLPGNSFDRIICNAAFPHFEDRKKALAEMVRMLRPGGTLVISHPIGRDAVNRLHREVSPVVAEDHVPAAHELRRMLEEVGLFEILIVDEPDFYLAAGHKPPGEETRPGW